MAAEKIHIFDTTLRDGTQGEKVAFSVEDKLRIAHRLDQAGIDYIEGGWPGSNPKDMDFFERAKSREFQHAKLVAFGSTQRCGHSAEEDENLQSLISAETPAISIFGKSWTLHVEEALKISRQENLDLISNSVAFLKEHDKEVIYDAEHFFDGYKDDSGYALQTIKAAANAGADVLVLCDTNGGTLPHEMSRIIDEVREEVDTPLGIHAHNDGDLATANTLSAIEHGCRHVQGTVNGYGERCGNANLCAVIPNLQLKMGFECIPNEQVSRLTSLSHFVSELANLAHSNRMPYVGNSAFAHKGGVHVSAVMKNATTYEHIEPEQVGNKRRVLVSDLSGKSNISYKAEELGIDLDQYRERVPEIVERLKELENKGYQFEAADASFELLINKITENWSDYFQLEGFRVIIEKNASEQTRSEATIRVNVDGQTEHSAAEGNGPVHALDQALRKALYKFYPEISKMQLTDYKVRVLNEKDGTSANVRVLIDSANEYTNWGTIGVSSNIIEASWQALSDSVCYYMAKQTDRKPGGNQQKLETAKSEVEEE